MNRLSRAAKYMIILCVFLLCVNTLLACVLIRDSTRAIRTQIDSRMLDVANTAAAMLDGDVLKTLQAEDVDTPAYQDVYRTLSRFKENIELEYIYCVRDLGGGNFVFMIDPDPEAPGEFGARILYTDALYQASLGTPGVDQVAYEDEWGRFYSAYSPVFDSEGRVAGIVAVDFAASWLEDQISHQMWATLAVCAFSMIFAVLLVFLIASRYRKRFGLLLGEMNAVGEGIETLVREVAPGAETEVASDAGSFRSADEIEELGDRIQALQTLLSEKIALVRAQAYVDGLTGLGNRAAYEEQVRRLDAEIREGTAAFTIAVFDLNGLKEINDKFGHERGDETIRAAAEALKRRFPAARQYRIGGDEFIVIREGGGAALTGRCVDFHEGEGFSASGGCATYQPGTDLCYRMVFSRADLAMYEDKKDYYEHYGDRRKR